METTMYRCDSCGWLWGYTELPVSLTCDICKEGTLQREGGIPPVVVRFDNEEPGGSTPEQYGLPEGATELQDLIEYREMNFAMGNIFKATYRWGNCGHSDRLRDINKIIWFANREKERLLKDDNTNT